MSLKVNGQMTKLTVKEHMFIKTVPSTLANGKMIYNTVKVLRPGQMDRVMMVSTKMVKKHGNGKYSWTDGSCYDGDWYENKIRGNGTYEWLDGRKFTG